MGVRAIQARLECSRTTLEYLWRTHVVFNQRLPDLLKVLFQMRRGEFGATDSDRAFYQRVGHFITAHSSQDADYLLNSVSLPNWKPNTAKKHKAKIRRSADELEEVSGESWADEAVARSKTGQLVFDKEALSGDLPGPLRQMLSRESVAIISGYDELSWQWKKRYEEWQQAKSSWESNAEHQKYLQLLPEFEKFERSAGGLAGKRRNRWHLYLNWLREHPELAAWRGAAPGVTELSDEAKARVEKAPARRQRSVEAEEFWKVNPELKALDRLHGEYRSRFMRFERRTTFTMPHASKHPRWFVFNKPKTNPEGYRNLRLPSGRDDFGSIELLLLTGDKNGAAKYPCDWVSFRFRGDDRLARFREITKQQTVKKGKLRGQQTEAKGFLYEDPHLKQARPATISGAKLLLRKIRLNKDGSLKSAAPYLIFTVTLPDMPYSEAARNVKKVERRNANEDRGPDRGYRFPKSLVACAVDLQLTAVGFATHATYNDDLQPQVIRSRKLSLRELEVDEQDEQRWAAGPELPHIAQHKKRIRRLRKLRGKPVRGQQSHVGLQDHITNMGEDRFKKSARRIVSHALNLEGEADRNGQTNPRADVLLIERLGPSPSSRSGLIPDAARERGINRALASWNRAHLIDKVEELAADCGLKVIPLPAFGTSQVCSRCGTMGRRYSLKRNRKTKKLEIVFGFVEKLFACPQCGYRANADHNASVNLHRRFCSGEAAIAALSCHRKQTDQAQSAAIDQIEAALLPSLRQLHNIEDAPF